MVVLRYLFTWILNISRPQFPTLEDMCVAATQLHWNILNHVFSDITICLISNIVPVIRRDHSRKAIIFMLCIYKHLWWSIVNLGEVLMMFYTH